MGAGLSARATGLPRYDSISAMMEGLPEPPYQALYFTPFHCAGLCDDVIMMPPAAPRSRTPQLSAGVGVMALASITGMPVAAATSAQARANALEPKRVSYPMHSPMAGSSLACTYAATASAAVRTLANVKSVSYTHLRAHETGRNLV